MSSVVSFASCEPLNDKEAFGNALGAVSEYRSSRVERLKFDSSRVLSLTAGKLLEDELSKITGDAPGTAHFVFGANGKPYLKDRPDIKFSLSHSGTYAMCAVSTDDSIAEIGCDIEKIDASRGTDIADRFFYFREAEYINSVSGLAKTSRFFRLWVLKESVMKATGLGISLGLNNFEIEFDQNDKPFVAWISCPPENHFSAGMFCLSEIKGPEGYMCAVAELKK